MNRRYGGGAIADRKSDALWSAATAVTGREHPWKARFESAGRPWFCPSGKTRNFGTGQEKPLCILHDQGRQEIRSWFAPIKMKSPAVGSSLTSPFGSRIRTEQMFSAPSIPTTSVP